MSARTCVEQLVDLHITLCYLGVLIQKISYMFGDNKSVVNSLMHPTSRLRKGHVALSYHLVRAAIASGNFVFSHISGENNPADILSKHWAQGSVGHMLQLLFYYEGDTIGAPGKQDSVRSTVSTTDSKMEISASSTLIQSTGDRTHETMLDHSVESSEGKSLGQSLHEVRDRYVYRCSSKLGSINFPEGISDPYLSLVRTNTGYFDSHVPYVGHTWPTTYTTALYDCGYTSNDYISSADKLPSLKLADMDHIWMPKEDQMKIHT